MLRVPNPTIQRHYKAEGRTEYPMHHKPTVTIMFYLLNFFRHLLLTDCNTRCFTKQKKNQHYLWIML